MASEAGLTIQSSVGDGLEVFRGGLCWARCASRTGKQLARLTGHTGPVNSVAFSPDGKTLASAGGDNTVRLWDPATRKQLARLTGHTGSVSSVAFSPDGKTLASAGDDTVRLWDEIFWRSLAELRATVCDVLLTGLRRSEWDQYAAGIPYRQSCP